MDVRAYHSWTSEEEEALRKGVEKHGLGSWEVIRKDPEFGLERYSAVSLRCEKREEQAFARRPSQLTEAPSNNAKSMRSSLIRSLS